MLKGILCVAVVTLAVTGCNDDGKHNSSNQARATIGAAGGTLHGPDGIELEVPAGAVAQPTEFGIAKNAAGAPPSVNGFAVAASIYELTPHDTFFNAPVTVSMPVPSNAAEPVLFMASQGEDWSATPFTLENRVARWQRNGFSWLRWGLACSVPAGSTDPFPCDRAETFALATATPAGAITPVGSPSGPVAIGGFSTLLIDYVHRVDRAATVHMKVHYSAVSDCVSSKVQVKHTVVDPVTGKLLLRVEF